MTKSAVLERGRRSTAGARMSTLVGQAVEDDDTFWNHSTWDDEKGGGDGEESDGSFRESDEDEENRKDAFDSDFNDSESDADDDKVGEAKVCGEEEDLRREEKREQGMKKTGVYKEPPAGKKLASAMTAGRELMQKRKSVGARKKALKGEGMNAGLVLNFPGAAPLARGVAKKVGDTLPGPALKLAPHRQGNRLKTSKSTGVARSRGVKRSLRASTITTSIQANAARQAAKAVASTTSKAKVQKNFTQEELILEALQVTEAENERWILSRKRILDEEQRAELQKKLLGQNASKGKIIRKTYSRRGCYNTITFPDMDYVPEIFTRSQEVKNAATEIDERKKADVCIITGKVARYRDPKTMKAYHDLAAFKVLRKRFEAGESLEGPVGPDICPSLNLPISTNELKKSLPETVTLSDLPDTHASRNSLTSKLVGNDTPTNHLLENGPTTSSVQLSSEARRKTKPKENEMPNNQLSSNVPSTTKLKKHDTPTNHLLEKDTTTSSFPLRKSVSPKRDVITALKIDSQNRMNTKMCLNDANRLGKPKLEKVVAQKPYLNSSTGIAESKVNGEFKKDAFKCLLNPFQALEDGQDNCGGETFNLKVEAIIAKVPSSLFSTPGNMKQENSGTTETDLKVRARATVPVASVRMPGDVKEGNNGLRLSDSKVKAMMATLPAVSINMPGGVSENKTITPTKVHGANYAMKPHFIPKYSNAAKLPLSRTKTKRALPTSSSTGKKKRRAKKVIQNVESPSAVASSAYFGDLHAPLATHLSGVSMAPGFYHPVPNFSNQHLRHLITKSNQMPYGYSHPIQPPPVDMATLYALSLTSPLRTVTAPLPLTIQNQLLHQRGNPLPALSYPQPSHMPVASGNIMGNLMRAYNIVSTADIEQRAKQQQQEYQASKNNENGHS